MSNKAIVYCAGCDCELGPGEGKRWKGERPPWSRNYRGFVCEDCFILYRAWEMLRSRSLVVFEEVVYWINQKVEAKPIKVKRGGAWTDVDARSLAVGYARDAILMAGIGCLGTARLLVNWLEGMDAPVEAWQVDSMGCHFAAQVRERIRRVCNV